MVERKQWYKYYFTVEGETEKWYFAWLKKQINDCEKSEYKVDLNCEIQKNLLRKAKKMTVTLKLEIYHISDYESNDEFHVSQFISTIDNLKKANSIGKQISYKFGYSNFTFDLWIILHKENCITSFTDRKHYIRTINSAYNENFLDMKEYKHEDNFKRLLSSLSLEDVIIAVKRSKDIMARNKDLRYTLYQHKGVSYYKENPSLMVWEPIEKILIDCCLI